MIIGGPDGLELIDRAADVMPRQPLARPAARRLAIAEMKSRLDRAVIWLAAGRQAAARGARFKIGIANGSRHFVLPGRTCPIFVQYTGKTRMQHGGQEMQLTPTFPRLLVVYTIQKQSIFAIFTAVTRV